MPSSTNAASGSNRLSITLLTAVALCALLGIALMSLVVLLLFNPAPGDASFGSALAVLGLVYCLMAYGLVRKRRWAYRTALGVSGSTCVVALLPALLSPTRWALEIVLVSGSNLAIFVLVRANAKVVGASQSGV